VTVQLERYAINLLYLRPDAPRLNQQEAAALQNAHMAHLAELHEGGHVLAGGPVFDPEIRGLNILRASVEEAQRLLSDDPAVRIGRLRVSTLEWMVPAGAMHFTRTHFPRSMEEVGDGG
jgi:uncharacterized protein YciI